MSFAGHEWTGIFELLRDAARFAAVTLKYGTLYWPHDELDMALEPLYAAARQRPPTALSPNHHPRSIFNLVDFIPGLLSIHIAPHTRVIRILR